jgi:hypothetical protein
MVSSNHPEWFHQLKEEKHGRSTIFSLRWKNKDVAYHRPLTRDFHRPVTLDKPLLRSIPEARMDRGTSFAIYRAVGLVPCIAMEVSGQNRLASSGDDVASFIFGPVNWGPPIIGCAIHGI